MRAPSTHFKDLASGIYGLVISEETLTNIPTEYDMALYERALTDFPLLNYIPHKDRYLEYLLILFSVYYAYVYPGDMEKSWGTTLEKANQFPFIYCYMTHRVFHTVMLPVYIAWRILLLPILYVINKFNENNNISSL